MPITDPEFWIVSLVALGAALWLGRGLLPGRVGRKPRPKRATLTIGGRPLDR